MVRRVNHDTDNSQRRLLTIQWLHDSKWREKQGEKRARKIDYEGEERCTEQEEIEKVKKSGKQD